MASQYNGNFGFHKLGILMSAPSEIGVYYCGNLNRQGQLQAHYIGRALGEETSIRSRLLSHVNDNLWENVTHFGFYICSSAFEAEELERNEIKRLNPMHNTQGKYTLHDLAKAMAQESARIQDQRMMIPRKKYSGILG